MIDVLGSFLLFSFLDGWMGVFWFGSFGFTFGVWFGVGGTLT
jgi:hypothetical protein